MKLENNGLFTIPQNILSIKSWKIMLKKKSEEEIIKEKQEKIKEEIFK